MGNSKPVLITGGAGFIGSHLVDLLREKGITYLILDNLSSGLVENIPEAINSNSFICGNINDHKLLQELITGSSCVIHLASTVGVKNVINNPLETIDTNINSLKFIASHCSTEKIPLIYFSSSLVYSSHKKNNYPYSEDEQVHSLGFHPVSMYTVSKKMGELICEYYRDTRGLKYIIIRPFNLIGIRQRSDSGMVVPTFIRSALEQKVINVYGDGRQTRVFSDVNAAVEILWQLINKDKSYGHIFNLAASDYSISMIELAEKIKEILDEPIQIKLIPYKEIFGDSFRDVQSRSPSLVKLKAATGFRGQRDLSSTLKEIIEYEINIASRNSRYSRDELI